MKRSYYLGLIFLSVILLCCRKESLDLKTIVAENLRCEYLTNPLGLDEQHPRFSWTLKALDSKSSNERQTAYRMLVSQSEERLSMDEGELWDSGWVISNETQHIEYRGEPIVSDKTYYWKVGVKNKSGQISGWSTTASFTTGLLEEKDWTAQWIGTDEIYDPKQRDCNISDPWIRKTIELKQQPFRAMLFVASVGYHELYVNGEKIGDEVLAPCVSYHYLRARYIAYDIARFLKPGKNTVALWLGTSWSIFQPYQNENKPATPIVIAQGDIYYDRQAFLHSEPSASIRTDDTWKTHPSPNKLLGNWSFGNMGGELWDANKEIPDWNLTAFDDSGWGNATVYHPSLILSAQKVEGNRLFEKITPVAIEERPDGTYRVDMGVNFAGWTEIKVKGAPNDRIDFLFSEREQNEMTFNNHSAYIIDASGKGTFKNRFNYSSGRWITIRGLRTKPQVDDVCGWQLRTAYEPVTSFECSDTLQNWIYNRIRWTFENLSIGGYIVDCPQRERLGYGGDAHATSETGLFNYRLGAFYSKWMEDWRDVQGTESMDKGIIGGGILPHTAPTCTGGGGPAWGGICVTLPWFIYQHEGDRRILEQNFEMIKQWIAFLDTHVEGDVLQRFGGNWDFLGDWLWPGATAEGMNNDKPENLCFNNCYRVFNLRTAAKIAHVLGKDQEAQQWVSQANSSSQAIHKRFYNADDYSYSDRSMGNLAAALLAEVPPVELQEGIMKRLEKEILDVRGGHIHVGITGGALLFKLLRDKGRDDLIYSMTSQTDYPGWGYMKDNGATTIWEMWEKDLPGHSLLHSSYLYPGAWYIDGVAGIRRDPEMPGFRRFIIRPPFLPDDRITWTKASFDSPVGMIRSDWKKEDGQLTLQVTVPVNARAIVYFPSTEGDIVFETPGASKLKGKQDNYTLFELPSGNYTMTAKLPSGLSEETISEKQAVLNGVFILFLFCLIMSSRIFYNGGKLMMAMFTELFRQKERKSIFSETVGNEIFNKILLCLQTILIFSIFAYKVFSVRYHVTDVSLKTTFLMIGASCLALGLFLLYKCFAYFLIGKIFFNKESFSQWMNDFTSLTALLGIVVFIPVLLMFYIDSAYLYCCSFIIFCFLLCTIVMIYRTYVLFFHYAGLLLYLFLYLCGQEMAPLVVLCRGLVYLFNVAENNIL